MPVLLIDGEPFRISLWSPLLTRKPTHDDWLAYNAKRDKKAESRAKTSSKPAAGGTPWTPTDDKHLIKLLTFGTPWNRISVALDRPVKELQRRWDFIRDGSPKQAKGGLEDRAIEPAKPEKHVSFAEPVVTDEDTDKDSSDTTLSPEHNNLLRKIAEKWERDRWFAISTRFNDKTGQNITPEFAKSIIEG